MCKRITSLATEPHPLNGCEGGAQRYNDLQALWRGLIIRDYLNGNGRIIVK